MIQPKNETEDLWLSLSKNCKTLFEQTKSKPPETLEFTKNKKPRRTFHFNPPISIEGGWVIVLLSLEVYNSTFNKTGENKKMKLHKNLDEKSAGVSYGKVRADIGRVLKISYITPIDLHEEIIGPNIIEDYREKVTKRRKNGKFMDNLAIYNRCRFQEFESFLRTEIDLIEDDIRLVLDENQSSFITYELEPGIYTFKDLSEALFNILEPEYELLNNSVDIAFNDLTMKTKLVVRPGIIAIKFDKKSFFNNIFGFKPYWEYKHNNEYISHKFVNLTNTNKKNSKCDII